MIRRYVAILLAAAMALAACGGGSSGKQATSAEAAAAALSGVRTAPAQRQILAISAAAADAGTVDPTDAANQLFDFAEVYFPAFFPGHPATGSLAGFAYRHYPETGIYLGVRDGEVYVLGGAFGTEVVRVGALAQIIRPAPRVLSTLCTQAGEVYDTYATPSAAVGKNAGVTLAACSDRVATTQWRQTAGPSVALLSDKTQTLSFDPPAPGTYSFAADFTGSAGLPQTRNITVQVAAASPAAASVTARASLSVRMGGKVSARAWPLVPDGDSVKAVLWTQIEGPPVELDTKTSRLALFTAPQVSRDTVIRLRATLYTTNGLVDSDEVMILVERYAQAAESDRNAVWAGTHVSRVYPYVAGARYASALRGCVYDAELFHSGPRANVCQLVTLPFLAQETGGETPTVEQVMGRVLVSHDWLGRNFEALLRNHDANGDIRRMLRSVTAIVLSTEIRPAFYYGGTGAIHLDAEDFWLTAEERDTINEAPDFRSDFGNGLLFDSLWRYTRDNKSIFPFYDPRLRQTRTLAAVHDEAAWVLIHELAHAADYLPESAYPFLQARLTAWDNIAPRYTNYLFTSDTVPAAYPLASREWADLAQVLFQGVTASPLQRSYTPQQVAGFFSADLATDDYAYSTPFEDIAMTLEEVLMQRRLGIRRDIAFIDPYDRKTMTASNTIVRWGQRGRVGDPAIRPRARQILQELAPWVSPGEIDQLAAPLAMRAGESWGANLSQEPPIPRVRTLNAEPGLQEMLQFQRDLQRMRRHHHIGAPRLPPVAGAAVRRDDRLAR